MTNEEMRKLVAVILSSAITQAQASFLRDAIYLASDTANDPKTPQPQLLRPFEKKQPLKSCGTRWEENEKQLLRDRFDEWCSATSKKRKAICAELGKVVLRSPGGVDSMFKDIGKEPAE